MSKILIVDDSVFQRRKIQKALQSEQYDILEASNGQQGLNAVRDLHPDCVILDLLMPDMSGLDFLKILRERSDATPVVVLTADIQETTSQECLNLGAREVLHKLSSSSETETLRQTIAAILNRSQ